MIDLDISPRRRQHLPILTQPPDSSSLMQLPERSLVQWVLESRNPHLLDWVCLRARDRVRSIYEAIERPVANSLLQLTVTLLAGQLVGRDRYCFDC